VGLLGAAMPAHAADENKESHVLILNGSDPYLPSFLGVDSAMRKALEKGRGDRRIVPPSEPLDPSAFP